MVDLGYEAPSADRGIDWQRCTSAAEAGEYIVKIQEGRGLGNEIARGDMKRGRYQTMAMFELMNYFRETGDARVIPRWREYEQATFCRKAITWSNGLRKKYLGDEPELTDEEIAAADKGGVIVARGESNADGMRIARTPGLKTYLMEVLEEDGFPALVQAFTALHLTGEIEFTDPVLPRPQPSSPRKWRDE
jgi:hypothetical protein